MEKSNILKGSKLLPITPFTTTVLHKNMEVTKNLLEGKASALLPIVSGFTSHIHLNQVAMSPSHICKIMEFLIRLFYINMVN